MSENTSQPSAIDSFIADFHRHELEADLLSLCDSEGFPWWDLIRYSVQFSLCVEQGIHGHPKSPTAPPLTRAKSFAKQSVALARDTQRLRRIAPGQVSQMLIATRHAQPLEHDADEMRREGRVALLVNRDGLCEPPHRAIAKQSIDFFTRLSMRTMRMPPSLAATVRKVADAVGKRFESRLDIFAIIEQAYCRHLAAKRPWSFVLDRMGSLERIAFVNDGTLKTLVFLAKERGIATQEIQHGYMGRSHVGYSYPPVEHAPATLPGSVLITRETGDIVYPVEKVLAPKPSIDLSQTPRDIDVLVAASPANMQRTLDVTGTLLGRGWHVAVKLHPSQTAESSGLSARFSSDELTIHDSSEKFVSLAQRAKVFVPANPMSTTTYEAVENGAKLIVVDYDGVKMTSQADGIVFARVDAVSKLAEAVANALAER